MSKETAILKLRKTIRQRRKEIPIHIRQAATARIGDYFQHLSEFKKAQRVAGFLAFDGEADPIELMIAAVKAGKQVFVPTIIDRNQPLLFIPWSPEVELKPNRFGIQEPDQPRSTWIVADQLDFVINPLVAFDQNCHRLGVGGGYYDRTFQFLNSSSHRFEQPMNRSRTSRRPVLAGFAFEMQRVEAIERQEWDVFLDWVITECRIYRRFR